MGAFSAFSAKGEWYKGNCHTHTTLSDGKETPQEVARAYRKKGYDFLVLTDHGKCHQTVAHLQRDGFLVINGMEFHPANAAPVGFRHHLVGIGVEKGPGEKFFENRSAASAIRWVKRNGGLVFYAHPYWTGHDIFNMKEGRSAIGMEVFNSTCEVNRGLGDASVHLDQALSHGLRWSVIAVDDSHLLTRDAFGGWIMLKARKLTCAAVMSALATGHFYASCGPQIESLTLKRGIVRISCSPVAQIVWHCEGPGGRRAAPKQGKSLLTTDEFDLKRVRLKTRYLRVEIMDSRGRKAWSNPIFRNAKTGKWTD